MFLDNNTSNAELLKASALHTAILTSANFAIIATDEDGVIQLFNVGAQRMLGYEAAEVINRVRPSAMHDPAEVAQRAMGLSAEFNVHIAPGFEALAYKASRGIEDVYETTYICKDGSRLPIMVSITALRDTLDNIIGYLIIATDNSQRKRAEVELKLAMEAVEAASNSKSEFMSRMSHELRTPLNAILGFAQLIESGNPSPTAMQKRSVDQILKGGWYLLELINEILDLALVESGRLALSIEPVSVANVMLECSVMVEPLAKSHDVRICITELDKPVFVSVDRIRIKQVMINLLINAIKYNRPGGSVTVDFSACNPRRLCIDVRDTGVGLTRAQLLQLFQAFNRLGREGSGEEGTGIGLVVTKRLVELMGGKISVKSTVGVGSVFRIELPLTEAPELDHTDVEAAPAEALPAKQDVALYSVLYVEDNPANLELVQQIIARRPDVHIFSATEAGIGIALARSHRPDVILMDINLPGISGLDAMQILRADPRTAHIPILALSANAVQRDIKKAIAAGFVDYITKPLKVSAFLQALDTALLLSQKNRSPITTTTITTPTKETA
jgi:signal transduction histidine kinase/ActR/RegA family two-component response regulator